MVLLAACSGEAESPEAPAEWCCYSYAGVRGQLDCGLEEADAQARQADAIASSRVGECYGPGPEHDATRALVARWLRAST